MKMIAAVAAIAALAGCKADVHLTLFASDLVDSAAGKTPPDINATVTFDTGSAQKCADLSPAIVTMLQTGLPAATFIGCRNDALTHAADFRIAIPFAADALPKAALTIAPVDLDGQTFWALFADADRLQAMADTLPPDAGLAYFGTPEPTISLTVQNDTAETVAIQTFGAFVDGKPRQGRATTDLPRRGELTVRLSDVANAALTEPDNGAVLVGVLAK